MRLPEAYIEEFVPITKIYPHLFKDGGIQRERQPRRSEILAIIVSKTPDLRLLFLDSEEDITQISLIAEHTTILKSCQIEHPLAHLRYLDLGRMRGRSLFEVTPLQLLPPFVAFGVRDSVCWVANDDYMPSLPTASSNISTLYLRSCVMDEVALNAVIGACKHLKLFEYSPWSDCIPDNNDIEHLLFQI